MTKTLKWLGGGVAAALLLGLAGLFSGADLAEAQPEQPDARFTGTVTLEGEPAAAGTAVVAIVAGAECGSGTVTTGANGSRYTLNSPADCAESGDEVSFHVGGVAAAETGTWNNTALNVVDLTATTPEPEPEPEMPMDDCPDEGMNGMDDGMDGDGASDDPPEPGMNGDDPPEPGMNGDDPPEPGMNGDGDMGDGDGDMGDGDGDMAGDDCPTVDDGMDGDDDGMDGDDDGMDGDDTGMDGDDTGMDGDDDGDDTDMAPEAGDTGTGLATSNTTSLAAILGVMALAITLGGYTFARRRR